MDPKINERKEYINISKSSSEEIYAMLDEVESDLEEDIDQLVNDSDTEFVADEDLPECPPLSKKKKKDKAEATINWSKQAKLNERIPCNLKAEVLHDSNKMFSPLDVFEKVMSLDKLVTVIVTETNRYAQQNGRNFVMNVAEMRAFVGMNHITGVYRIRNQRPESVSKKSLKILCK